MVVNKQVFVSFICGLTFACTYAQREKLFFRKDYTYIESVRSFYKIHTLWRKYVDALVICETEGAELFYPEDEQEAKAVIEFWHKTNPVGYVTIGVTSFLAKGVFETTNGQPISTVYNKWDVGQPDNRLGVEDCVEMRRDSTLHDVNCEHDRAFICKKKLSTLVWNDLCDIPRPDYFYEGSMGKCYKLHKELKTWQEAYYTCHTEQSYLAVVDNEKEVNHLVDIIENAVTETSIDVVHLGFQKRRRGWSSIKGKKLDGIGFVKPSSFESDDPDKNCGSILKSGELRSINCVDKKPFICEYNVVASDAEVI